MQTTGDTVHRNLPPIGDAANAVLAAVGYNFRRLIRWLSLLLRKILSALTTALQTVPA